MKTLKKSKSFSIVEVIVVCAVVAILASLIMSASSSVREAGRKTTCLNNLKQIQAIYEAYRKDYRKAPAGDLVNHDDFRFAEEYISASDLDTFICPGDEANDLVAVNNQKGLLDALNGHTSYSYIPNEAYVEPITGFVRGDYEVAGKDSVDLSTLELVAFDKNDENHHGSRNIVYFNGSGNSKSGIAQTIKAFTGTGDSNEYNGSYEDSASDSNVADNDDDNAADNDDDNVADNDDENAADNDDDNAADNDDDNAADNDDDNAADNDEEEKSPLEEAQEELEAREDELAEASEEAEEAEEAAKASEEAEEAAKEEAAEAKEEADQTQENKKKLKKNWKK